ncbi:acyl-CoA thioesterase II [Notoacmeibacter marinus]|uniref:Acyl-CoA thioesterase 2 n=1 Tax=Notoacmeibacter marinus TaxID=1876515 RepID=A0A231V2G6_9HYPH|nr:acyl-CoA thioesterase II [Notoacmeibacter marinus]OXT02344.1 acyl-CoA thioesterase II [Notoacmeibacter marinus]
MSDPIAELLHTLSLERLEHNLYRGNSPKVGWQRVFGGQVIGQALVAAQQTVEEAYGVHSLHAYFLRPGDPAVPIIYQVDRIRDGRSFVTRRVNAIQHGHAIFSLMASFQLEEDGLEHQAEMPDVPTPEELDSDGELMRGFIDKLPQAMKNWWERPRPFEFRPVVTDHYLTRDRLEPVQHVWIRTLGEVPDDNPLRAAILAYASDMTLLDAATFPHGRSVWDPQLQMASLDHAMWFHRHNDLSDWMLYTSDSPSSMGSRGFTRGMIFSRDGQHVASVAQEGLMRVRTPKN